MSKPNEEEIIDFYKTAHNISIRKEDLMRPTKDFVVQLYACLLEQFFNIRQPDIMACTNSFEHMEHAVLISNVYVAMKRLVEPFGINDFELTDLMAPKRARTNMILSAFAMFHIQYTQIKDLWLQNSEKFSKLSQMKSDLKKKKIELKHDIEDKSMLLSSLKSKTVPQEKELKSLEQEFEVKKREAEEEEERSTEIKVGISSLKEKLCDIQLSTTEVIETNQKLSQMIIESPETLIQSVQELERKRETLKESLPPLKAQQNDSFKVKNALICRIKACTDLAKEYQDLFTYQSEIEEKCKALDQMKNDKEKLEEEMIEMKQKKQQVESSIQSLQTMIEKDQQKFSREKQNIIQMRDLFQEKLRAYEEQSDRVGIYEMRLQELQRESEELPKKFRLIWQKEQDKFKERLIKLEETCSWAIQMKKQLADTVGNHNGWNDRQEQEQDDPLYQLTEWIEEEARRDYLVESVAELKAMETATAAGGVDGGSTTNTERISKTPIPYLVAVGTDDVDDDNDGDDDYHQDQVEISRSNPECIGHCDDDTTMMVMMNQKLELTNITKSSDDNRSKEGEEEKQTVSEWDLKTFLSETAVHRHDIDVLIMSEAGKPIYCYSGREDVTTLMGVCVALLNYVIKTQNDQLRTIRTRNGLHINFAIRSPLVIVVVCRKLSCFDEQTLINQIHSQIISTITLKKLKSIFQQAPTYDLKRIIHTNDFKTLDILVKSITTPISHPFPTYKNKRYKQSGRLFDNVISFYTSTSVLFMSPRSSSSSSSTGGTPAIIHDHKPNVLSRVYVPVAIMNMAVRDQITGIINQLVSVNSDIVFSILFHLEDSAQNGDNGKLPADPVPDEPNDGDSDLYASFEDSSEREAALSPGGNRRTAELKLITVCNHTTKFRINPLDIQLLYALIKASDSLLSATESLWIPLCLSRVDANRFLHAHVSYLSRKYCLILLDVDHNNFDKCRQVKETINFRLDQIRMAEPMIGLRSNISELGQPHLQYVCHQTTRNCVVWQSSVQTELSPLNYYLIERMQRSSLKTLWLRSMKHQCAVLGWQTATFQLYAQFDGFVTKQSALETVQTFLKWFKKEEDRLVIKD